MSLWTNCIVRIQNHIMIDTEQIDLDRVWILGFERSSQTALKSSGKDVVEIGCGGGVCEFKAQ